MNNPHVLEILSDLVSSPIYLNFIQLLRTHDICQICDSHVHISSGKEGLLPGMPDDLTPQYPFSIEDLLFFYDTLFGNEGIKYSSIIFDTPLPAYDLAQKNDDLLAFHHKMVDSDSERVVPFAVITPEMESRQIEKWVSGGVKGFKMTPRTTSSQVKRGVISDVTLSEMLNPEALQIADQNHLTLLVHLPQLVVSPRIKPSLKNELLQIARKFSNLRIILAHLGQAQTPAKIQDLLKLIEENRLYERIWMDISAVTIPSVLEIALESKAKLLFGTDIDFALVERGRYVMFKSSNGKRVLAEEGEPGNVITSLVSQNFGQQLRPFIMEQGIDLDAPLLLFQFEGILNAVNRLQQKGVSQSRIKEILEALFFKNAWSLV